MDKKSSIKKKILQKELQLKKIHYHQASSEVCLKLYNTLILEKAILKKELEDANKIPFVEKIKRLIPRREKLICDYFKS